MLSAVPRDGRTSLDPRSRRDLTPVLDRVQVYLGDVVGELSGRLQLQGHQVFRDCHKRRVVGRAFQLETNAPTSLGETYTRVSSYCGATATAAGPLADLLAARLVRRRRARALA